MKVPCQRIGIYLISLTLGSCGGGGATTTPMTSSSAAPASTSAAAIPQLAASTAVVDGASIGATQWPDGPSPSGATGQPVSGLDCTRDGGTYSYTHLSIVVDGVRKAIPANIGTVPPPNSIYGCAYPIQTNDQSGKIRTRVGAAYTLGQFFALWGQPLSATNVAGLSSEPIAFFVNDGGALTQFNGDPASIALTPNREVTIVVGNPPPQIPTYSWTNPPPLDATMSQLTATVGTAAVWPDGDGSSGGQGQTVDDLACGPMVETYHVHPHVSIIEDGTMLIFPQYIGITANCYYNIHVHDQSGVIHVETPFYNRRFTLGNLFDVWGQPLSSTNVAGITGKPIAVYIEDTGNVRRWSGDIRDIDLFSKRSITIQIGSRLSSIPTWDWTNAGYTH